MKFPFNSSFHKDLLNQSPIDLVLRLSAIFYLFRGFEGPAVIEAIMQVLCLGMLLSPSILRSQKAWFGLFLCALIIIVSNRNSADNHKFLMTYWLLAILLSINEEDPWKALKLNGRIIVGLVFAFAAIWKLIPGEFLDGSFFHATYLTDSRFFGFSILAGDLNANDIQQNKDLMRILRTAPGPDVSAVLHSTSKLQFIALLSSYWTIAIEGCIALGFLIPWKGHLKTLRNAFLLIFVCTTYFLAPVISFGLVLVIMGLAQCELQSKKWRLAYVYAFFLIQFSAIIPGLNRFIIQVAN